MTVEPPLKDFDGCGGVDNDTAAPPTHTSFSKLASGCHRCEAFV